MISQQYSNNNDKAVLYQQGTCSNHSCEHCVIYIYLITVTWRDNTQNAIFKWNTNYIYISF